MHLPKVTLFSLLASLATATVYFEERFGSPDALKLWKTPKTPLKNKEGQEYPLGEFVVRDGVLVTTEDSRYYALTRKLSKPFSNEGKTLVVQLTVRHPQQLDCGGGYIKLLAEGVDQDTFNAETPYLLMVGPDICGTDRRVHFILAHNGKYYQIKKDIRATADKLTHLYTFVLNPDQTYEVHVDQEKVAFGTLQDDWDIILPKRIPDPKATKPEDWDDRKEIDDPEDKRPADWDSEPEFIIHKDAKKPADWDDEMDGEWKAPKKRNPAFKGEWKPRKIANPTYQGEWTAPLIDNPEHVPNEKAYVLGNIGAVGFDLWQVKSGSHFDNILITDSFEYAKKEAEKLWRPQYEADKEEAADEERRVREESEKEIAAEKQRFEMEQLAKKAKEMNGDKAQQHQASKGDEGDDEETEEEDAPGKKKEEL